MFIEQPAVFLRWLYPTAIWRMSRKKKVVYLTFDDGPIPEATPFVLDTLDRFGIKATFFMVGDNVRKHPDIYRMVVERGHRVGNHTFNHIGGFRHSCKEYLENADKPLPPSTRVDAVAAIQTATQALPHHHVGLGDA